MSFNITGRFYRKVKFWENPRRGLYFLAAHRPGQVVLLSSTSKLLDIDSSDKSLSGFLCLGRRHLEHVFWKRGKFTFFFLLFYLLSYVFYEYCFTQKKKRMRMTLSPFVVGLKGRGSGRSCKLTRLWLKPRLTLRLNQHDYAAFNSTSGRNGARNSDTRQRRRLRGTHSIRST